MDKYLIINADDFGMSHSTNLAVFDLFEKGGITSATIMTPCGWAKEAGDWAAQHPEYAVGVHLTFTSEWGKYRWSPIYQGKTPSLRDKEDFMYHESDEFEENCDIDEVENEINAQIKRFPFRASRSGRTSRRKRARVWTVIWSGAAANAQAS